MAVIEPDLAFVLKGVRAMVSLFTKPIELITGDDVASVIGWPESLTVEYKRELPGGDGISNSWSPGREVDRKARDKLFKEIIALANTAGGHVILGIDETRESPPSASAVTPIPYCTELAERLERSAQTIDPPIPMLLVKPILTNGASGVILFRVPQSAAAPHRGLDKECYVRRGTSSVPVGMREIQDMTLAAERRGNQLEARFYDASLLFSIWSEALKAERTLVLFRISAFPAIARLNLPSINAQQVLSTTRDQYDLRVGKVPHRIEVRYRPERARPIVRGTRFVGGERHAYMNVYRDGLVTLGFASAGTLLGQLLAMEWVLGNAINVLRTADYLRVAGGQPDAEYAFEVEINASTPIAGELEFYWFEAKRGALGHDQSILPLVLPRLTFGPLGDIDEPINLLAEDILNAAGRSLKQDDRIHVELA